VASAPPGSEAALLDIEAAYRTIPVLPAHKAFIVVQHEGCYFIDHTLPFGVSSASGIQGEVADATLDLLDVQKLGQGCKWVDDFVCVRVPIGQNLDGSFIFSFDLSSIRQMTDPLGVPWHPSKGSDFGATVIYVGFLWDLGDHTVSLPEPKCLKYQMKLTSFLARLQVSLKDAMSLNGTLSHITFVLPHRRAYLSNLSQLIASWQNEWAPRHLPPSVKSDLRWWLDTLAHPPPYHALSPSALLHRMSESGLMPLLTGVLE
jgi:hypothetical protein